MKVRHILTRIIISILVLICFFGCGSSKGSAVITHKWESLNDDGSVNFTLSYTETNNEVISIVLINSYDYYENADLVLERTGKLLELNDADTDGFRMNYELVSVPGERVIKQEMFSIKFPQGFNCSEHKDVLEYIGLSKYCDYNQNLIRINHKKLLKDKNFFYHGSMENAEYNEIVREENDR